MARRHPRAGTELGHEMRVLMAAALVIRTSLARFPGYSPPDGPSGGGRLPTGRNSKLICCFAMASLENLVVLETTITCPECSRSETETMSAEARPSFYSCSGCGATLKPKSGDCCVYCSHSAVPCPSIQIKLWRLALELFTYDDLDSADSNHLTSDGIADR